MSWTTGLALTMTIGLVVYLLIAMLKPEKFA